MASYSEKLKDRRWQKKRLEILNRDGWTCQNCGSSENKEQLHVHHKYYLRNTDPWDYPGRCYTSLCSRCHESAGEHIGIFDEKFKAFFDYPQLSWMAIQLEGCPEDSQMAIAMAIGELLEDEFLIEYLVARKVRKLYAADNIRARLILKALASERCEEQADAMEAPNA